MLTLVALVDALVGSAAAAGCSAPAGPEVRGTGGKGPSAPTFGGAVGDAASSPPELAGAAGAAGAESTEPTCIPAGEDEPDDRFEDTDCDGIDGDVTRALFVSPTGDDAAAGTLDAPLATLQAAVLRARSEQKDVYVCNGSYEQALVIRGSGVRLYGGYDCQSGGRRIADRARITAQNAIPLSIEGAADVVIERLAFVAPDAGGAEESSVAGVIAGSERVQLRRVELVSGQAGPGRTGARGLPVSGEAPRGATGGTACQKLLCSAYGDGGYSTSAPSCEGGGRPEVGGRGGDGGRPGKDAQPGGASASGVLGGQVGSTLAVRDGQAGGIGRRGDTGGGPLAQLGELQGTTYRPTNIGQTGAYGHPGQAGGGGAGVGELWEGDLCCAPGHGGSQGGFGGCGGRPGHGGTGGGASIALMIVESDVALVWARLIAGNGGRGGTGGAGGPGQAGGAPGDVYSFGGVRLSGLGGAGGPGGQGGSGGPGGGGPSLGLALVASPMPVLEGVQVLLGLPGFGGNAADAASGVDGPDGVALPGYDFTAHEKLTF